MRQEVFFFPHVNELGKAAPSVKMKFEPKRVWTLFHDIGGVAPSLPIVPRHHGNAFLEDRIHDWNWKNGLFRYGSRVASGKVWLLLEFEEAHDVAEKIAREVMSWDVPLPTVMLDGTRARKLAEAYVDAMEQIGVLKAIQSGKAV